MTRNEHTDIEIECARRALDNARRNADPRYAAAAQRWQMALAVTTRGRARGVVGVAVSVATVEQHAMPPNDAVTPPGGNGRQAAPLPAAA